MTTVATSSEQVTRPSGDGLGLPSAAAQRIEELGRIIMAYSEVTDKLQQSHERLEQTVSTLRDELGEKNRLLERKNRLAALGEMAAGMAHEIRNPLGGIQLYASLLKQDMADRPGAMTLVGKIADGVRRLETLVSQVLQFTREMRASLVECDLAAVVEQAVDMAAGAFDSAGVKASVDGPPSLAVKADPLLLGQAILNLLVNAAEAIGGNGTVRVEFGPPRSSAARQFQIAVQDSGPGIPSQIMDRLFNPFFTTKDTGTGLGLAIVHRVVEAHDGSILAANAEGGGARFEIRI